MNDKLADWETRLANLEAGFSELRREMDTFKGDMSDKLDTIFVYVTGVNKILGFTRKNWKTALTFGAGIMSALGFGNPKLWDFISHFNW